MSSGVHCLPPFETLVSAYWRRIPPFSLWATVLVFMVHQFLKPCCLIASFIHHLLSDHPHLFTPSYFWAQVQPFHSSDVLVVYLNQFLSLIGKSIHHSCVISIPLRLSLSPFSSSFITPSAIETVHISCYLTSKLGPWHLMLTLSHLSSWTSDSSLMLPSRTINLQILHELFVNFMDVLKKTGKITSRPLSFWSVFHKPAMTQINQRCWNWRQRANLWN